MPTDPLDRLTDRQRECLRLFYAHYKPGEIATRLGISTDRVNQHFKGARERLRVNRTIDAARMLAAAESPPSQNVGAASVGLPRSLASGDQGMSLEDETGQEPVAELNEPHSPFQATGSVSPGPTWPVASRARPFNELTWYQRLLWAVAIGLGATVFAGAMISLQDAIH